jgi:ABC-2 type transport system permease protein
VIERDVLYYWSFGPDPSFVDHSKSNRICHLELEKQEQDRGGYVISGSCRIRGTAGIYCIIQILIGKILGSLVLNSLCILIIVIFSKFAFKANWGDHFGIVLLILLTEVILAVSFGLGLSYIAKTAAAARIIIMIIVQLASLVGGAYYKLSDTGGISSLSPLTWANTAITKIIYGNDLLAAIPVISLNIGISAVFLAIAIVSLRRREGL